MSEKIYIFSLAKTINRQRQKDISYLDFIMTYNVVYMDGDRTIRLSFIDQRAFLRWEECMAAIKLEAARIVEDNPNPEDLSVANVPAIRIWLMHVDAMREAGMSVLPSILTARNSFAQAICEH